MHEERRCVRRNGKIFEERRRAKTAVCVMERRCARASVCVRRGECGGGITFTPVVQGHSGPQRDQDTPGRAVAAGAAWAARRARVGRGGGLGRHLEVMGSTGD